METRDWRKAHAMVGVRTHIVTAVHVTGATSNDAPHLPELAKRTAKNCSMNEVSADKGYLTKNNAAEIEALVLADTFDGDGGDTFDGDELRSAWCAARCVERDARRPGSVSAVVSGPGAVRWRA